MKHTHSLTPCINSMTPCWSGRPVISNILKIQLTVSKTCCQGYEILKRLQKLEILIERRSKFNKENLTSVE